MEITEMTPERTFTIALTEKELRYLRAVVGETGSDMDKALGFDTEFACGIYDTLIKALDSDDEDA